MRPTTKGQMRQILALLAKDEVSFESAQGFIGGWRKLGHQWLAQHFLAQAREAAHAADWPSKSDYWLWIAGASHDQEDCEHARDAIELSKSAIFHKAWQYAKLYGISRLESDAAKARQHALTIEPGFSDIGNAIDCFVELATHSKDYRDIQAVRTLVSTLASDPLRDGPYAANMLKLARLTLSESDLNAARQAVARCESRSQEFYRQIAEITHDLNDCQTATEVALERSDSDLAFKINGCLGLLPVLGEHTGHFNSFFDQIILMLHSYQEKPDDKHPGQYRAHVLGRLAECVRRPGDRARLLTFINNMPESEYRAWTRFHGQMSVAEHTEMQFRAAHLAAARDELEIVGQSDQPAMRQYEQIQCLVRLVQTSHDESDLDKLIEAMLEYTKHHTKDVGMLTGVARVLNEW